MRAYEFEKTVDVHALCLHEAQTFLKQNTNIILESNSNLYLKEYKDIVDPRKVHANDVHNLNKGEVYFPVFLHAIPSTRYMRISAITKTIFTHLDNDKLYFKTASNRTIVLPATDRISNNMYANTLVFDTLGEQKQFLSMLDTACNDWNIHRLKI